MRISSNQIHEQAVRSMQEQQAQIQRTERQVATGLRVLQPSDDPIAASRILNLQENIDVIDQFSRNASLANSQLGIADAAYGNVSNSLQRIRELTVQGANGTNSADDRLAISTELRERLDELVALANSRDGNGEYIFAGSQVASEPFELVAATIQYSGDQLDRLLPVGEGTQVTVRDSGDQVFLRVDGGNKDMFAMVQDIITALEAPQPDDASKAAFSTAMGVGLTDMDSALSHTSQMRASIGARMNTIDNQESINGDFKLHLQTVMSETQDLDYAEAISRFNLQLTSLQAAQQAYLRVQQLSLFNLL